MCQRGPSKRIICCLFFLRGLISELSSLSFPLIRRVE
uniref:Uncharacterized protein n=1 Tax=Anguilla anguilla TaxID=7936 RepID=A0A0E9VJ87_ANGAN